MCVCVCERERERESWYEKDGVGSKCPSAAAELCERKFAAIVQLRWSGVVDDGYTKDATCARCSFEHACAHAVFGVRSVASHMRGRTASSAEPNTYAWHVGKGGEGKGIRTATHRV